MLVINSRNVNGAYIAGMTACENWQVDGSRNGEVVVCDTPVTTVYGRPQERVLFDSQRNANPFFHLFESLWMLAGRDDPEYLNIFIPSFGSRYAEMDTTGRLWGAYGHRWRNNFQFDQLDDVVARLRADSSDRRCVIQMWDCDRDLYKPSHPAQPKDVPCNTQIYPRVRFDRPSGKWVLDITVTCRSNDLIWGAYGANAVHFSVLQEYLAARIGVGVGVYYQVSNNMHVYTSELDAVTRRETVHEFNGDIYAMDSSPAVVVPMFSDYSENTNRDCGKFFDEQIAIFLNDPADKGIQLPWLKKIAQPMWDAHSQQKLGDLEAAERTIVERMPVCDWRLAGVRWLNRKQRLQAQKLQSSTR